MKWSHHAGRAPKSAMNSNSSSRGADMKAWALTGIMGGAHDTAATRRLRECVSSGGARDDGERAVAHVHARRRDRRALRLGQLDEAELAHDAAGLELVHQLARERDPAARRAAGPVGVAVARPAAEHGRKMTGHGADFARARRIPANPANGRPSPR